VCQYNSSTGAISDCADAGGSGFAQPDAVAFSPDGNYFYTANAGGGVTACLVDATTGHLSGCVNNSSVTFSAASDMTLNSTGTLAFVSNRGSSNVSVCNVSGLTVDSCFTTGSVMNQPEGITLSPSGLFAYITNAGDGTVTSCSVTQSGSLAGSLVSCATTGGEFHGTGNLAFDSIPAYAFVPNQLLGKIFVCQVTNVLGTLSGCVSSPNETFIGPSGIAIQ
jgi:DNA-binding beta-propeller fold protein YncE